MDTGSDRVIALQGGFSFSGKLRRLASAEGITAALVLSLAFTAMLLSLSVIAESAPWANWPL